MSISATQPPSVSSVDLEEVMNKRFRLFISKLPHAALEKAVKLSDREALAELSRAPEERARSVEIENQETIARMRAEAFVRVRERCDLLQSKEVCAILGISKQALSQRGQAGHLAIYTNQSNGRKYFPAFQFRDNKIRAVIAEVISEFEVDPADIPKMNMVVQHLITTIDYSNPGEPENIVPMHALLDDAAARRIIKREWDNRYLHGR